MKACGRCGDPIDDGKVVTVDDVAWHERCAIGHVIESLSLLTAPTPPLMSAREAGEQLGYSASTVNRLARAGAIGYVCMSINDDDTDGSERRFRQSHIDAFLDARERLADGDVVEEVLSPRRARPKPLTDRQRSHRSLVPRSQRDRQRGQH